MRSDPSASAHGSIHSAVERCLQAFGYQMDPTSTDADIRFYCHTDRGTWRSQYLVHESARILCLFIFLTDDGYPIDRQGWVVELISRMNDAIAVLGNYTLQWETGAALYRYAVDFGERDIELATVSDMLDSLAFPLDVWQRAYRHVHASNISPADALHASRIEEGVFDRENVNDATRRVMFSVVAGGAIPHSSAMEHETTPAKPPLTLL